MLEVRKLQLARGRGFALEVDYWQARPGQVQAILGTNGAGKSTLLRLLCAEQPSRRQVFLHGSPLEDWPANVRARHLGVLPQSSSLSFRFTAAEVVAMGLTPLSLGWREGHRQVAAVMRATACEHLAQQDYGRLSGGERQRVHLARVLLQLSQAEHTPVLLLDEPTSAQDLGHQHRMLTLVSTLAREHNYAVVAVLHDLNLALRYTDRALLLDRGRVIAAGATGSVITRERISHYWGYDADLLTTADGATVIA